MALLGGVLFESEPGSVGVTPEDPPAQVEVVDEAPAPAESAAPAEAAQAEGAPAD